MSFRTIPGYNDYEINDRGVVRSLDRKDSMGRMRKGIVLKQMINPDGYFEVNLYVNNQQRKRRIHTLLALAFLGQRPDGMLVCHGPQGKTVNTLENIYYGSYSRNQLDKTRDGTNHELNKEVCPRGHSFSLDNLVASQLPWRGCLAYSRAKAWVNLNGGDFEEVAQLCYDNRCTPSRLKSLQLI